MPLSGNEAAIAAVIRKLAIMLWRPGIDNVAANQKGDPEEPLKRRLAGRLRHRQPARLLALRKRRKRANVQRHQKLQRRCLDANDRAVSERRSRLRP